MVWNVIYTTAPVPTLNITDVKRQSKIFIQEEMRGYKTQIPVHQQESTFIPVCIKLRLGNNVCVGLQSSKWWPSIDSFRVWITVYCPCSGISKGAFTPTGFKSNWSLFLRWVRFVLSGVNTKTWSPSESCDECSRRGSMWDQNRPTEQNTFIEMHISNYLHACLLWCHYGFLLSPNTWWAVH